jgi:hypothetical protein
MLFQRGKLLEKMVFFEGCYLLALDGTGYFTSKKLTDVNEAYTSKTMSQCGKIKKNLGGSKTISDGFIKVDRDVNGARNIMLRALTVA